MKRPWNLSNNPIYSLATSHEGVLNMNICTYVTVVNMNPKIYAISLDYSTKTFKNILTQSTKIVLQLLSFENINIVRKMGKQSGNKINKHDFLNKKKMLTVWNDMLVLKNTSALIELELISKIHEMSDHAIFIFKAKKYSSNRKDVLCLNDLINNKIIL